MISFNTLAVQDMGRGQVTLTLTPPFGQDSIVTTLSAQYLLNALVEGSPSFASAVADMARSMIVAALEDDVVSYKEETKV